MTIPRAGIYAIENTVTGEVYVGSTSDLAGRQQAHEGALSRGAHPNRDLRGSVLQHGVHAFQFVVLQRVLDPVELELLEYQWMRKLDARALGTGFNARTPTRARHSRPSEQELADFYAKFTEVTAGLSDAEAARRLLADGTESPYGATRWSGGAVKQFRLAIQARAKKQEAWKDFRESGLEAKLLSLVVEKRRGGASWRAIQEQCAAADYVIPSTRKAFQIKDLKDLVRRHVGEAP